MKKLMLVFLFLAASFSALPQKKILRLAEIPGYVTLACDFHEHTIFSDGEVWPTVRLDEAEKNGLDVIAFTDHIEYLPHKEYLQTDLNSAWKIAREEGLKRDIIVVHGAEITRKMPPGHLNALFINDAGKLTDTTFLKVIEEAVAQGAFIQWNHPGWKSQRPDGIPRMDPIHHQLIDKGWLNGIEIYNDTDFYPDVMTWCIDYKLAMMGNTDIHGPVGTEDIDKGQTHPPMTLAFAKTRTENDLKAALMAGRTLVWFSDTLAGKKELASDFFLNSVEFGKIYYQNDKTKYRYITNKTEIPYNLTITFAGSEKPPVRMRIPANSAVRLKQPKESGNLLQVIVENVLVGIEEKLKMEIEL